MTRACVWKDCGRQLVGDDCPDHGAMPWWACRMGGFDLETTSPLPEEARIVTASLALVGGGEPTEAVDWLADPGVPIPDGAAEVHGITTEKAQAEGRPLAEVVVEVVERLRECIGRRRALVVFNARYDFTVLDRECRRLGIEPLPASDLLVVDPLVIDKWLHRYRKGSRKLEAQCAHYGATLDQAHASDADAIAAARLAWAMGARADVVRRVRNASDGRELAALKREWGAVRHDLVRLHDAQTRWALEERYRFAEYKASVGDREDADRIRAERGWPVLERMPHEPEELFADAA